MTTLTRALSRTRAHPASPAHRRAASIIYYDQTQLGNARHADPEAMAALRAASDIEDCDCPEIDAAEICQALTDLGYAPAHAARRAEPPKPAKPKTEGYRQRQHMLYLARKARQANRRRRIACARQATAV